MIRLYHVYYRQTHFTQLVLLERRDIMIKIDSLKYVVAVAEKGSISQAATSLFVSQPYLSRVIKEMEDNLGFQIFKRTQKGVRLTDEGTHFVNKAQGMIHQYKNLFNVEANMNENKNSFKITSVRSSLIMESFIELSNEYLHDPSYEFTLKEEDSQTPIHDMTYHEAELVIIYLQKVNKQNMLEKLERKDIMYQKICNLTICIILGTHHPLLKQNTKITIDKLYNYGFVTYEPAYLPYSISNHVTDNIHAFLDKRQINHTIYVNSRAALHNVLTQTNFFSIGTQAAKDQASTFNIVSIPIDTLAHNDQLEMGLLYRKNDRPKEITKRFIQKIQEKYGN